jgi:hypothetical protein
MPALVELASGLDSNNAEHFSVLAVPVSGFFNQEALQLAFVSSFPLYLMTKAEFRFQNVIIL